MGSFPESREYIMDPPNMVIMSGSSVIQDKNARSFMILPIKWRTEKFWNLN